MEAYVVTKNNTILVRPNVSSVRLSELKSIKLSANDKRAYPNKDPINRPVILTKRDLTVTFLKNISATIRKREKARPYVTPNATLVIEKPL
jgi:hypothetical protein